MTLIGNIIVLISVVFMLFGVIGIFRFKNFYTRLLVSSKIDTVGTITLIIGLALKHGASFFSLKLMLLMILLLIINPLTSHMVARSAYMSGYKNDGEDDGL